MRVYVDGVFDLFHRGHVESLKMIKNRYDNCELFVGVISDIDATYYKRLPIIDEEDRYEVIKSLRYVNA